MKSSDRRATGRVLVVDDSAVVQAVVRAGLTSFDVHEAVSGEDTLENRARVSTSVRN